MLSLTQFEANITSQNGEDGVLAEIFSRIGIETRTCIEFGAWDGKHLSNTWNLWHNEKWTTLLIEGDPSRFQDLVANTANNPHVTAVNHFVEAAGENTLDQIVKRAGFSEQIDLLSIDIDSDDSAILRSLNTLKPRVVVIEFNPTIPPWMDFVQEPGDCLGSSCRSILQIAKSQKYNLAHITRANLLLVRDDAFAAMGITEPDLTSDFPSDHLTFVVMSFNGRAFLSNSRLPFQPEPPSSSLSRLIRALCRRLFRTRRPSKAYPSLTPVEIFGGA